MAAFFYVLTVLGGLLGLAGLLLALALPGAPQQAALAAISVGAGVLPYVVARAITALREKD